MSGKNSKVELPHYLRTVHYGVCAGPVDSINQIWIGEKLIFCGEVTAPSLFYINLPDVFGGEAGQGGVKGVVEAYFGTPTQKATQNLAIRFGRDTDTMVAYRGFCGLFFRAADENDRDNMPTTPGVNVVSMASEPDVFVNAPMVSRGGFDWRTNDPYMPSTWVHATKIPNPFYPLGDDFARVYGNVPIGSQEIGGEIPVFQNGASVPYVEIPVTPEIASAIASGDFDLTMTTDVSSGTNCIGGHSWVVYAGVEFRDSFGSSILSSYESELDTPATITLTAPTNTASIFVWAWVTSLTCPAAWTGTAYWSAPTPFFGQAPLCADNGTERAPPDANPAFVIAYILTNKRRGAGEPLSSLNQTSFLVAAETLQTEGFGISFPWVEQMPYESIISEVLDHIQGVLFDNPTTGLKELLLIRGGYDVNSLRVLSSNNHVIGKPQRKSENDLINEVVVVYTDYQNENDRSVTYQDAAGVARLGVPVSQESNYYAIRNGELAGVVGARDLRVYSYPLFMADIEADRTFRKVTPGEVLIIENFSEWGISNMPVRVMEVNYGTLDDPVIRMSVVEDIFGLEYTAYSPPQDNLAPDTSFSPEPLAEQRVMETPLPLLLRSGFPSDQFDFDQYPLARTMFLAGDSSGRSFSVDVHGEKTLLSGEVTSATLLTVYPAAYGLLEGALAEESSSTLPGSFVRGLYARTSPVSGDCLYLDGDGASGEIVMLVSHDAGLDLWAVRRGLFDTIPRAWQAGDLIWVLGQSGIRLGALSTVAGATPSYNLLPRTSSGVLSVGDSTPIAHVVDDRQFRPFRPANCQIEASGFGPHLVVGVVPSTVEVTWSTRNRFSEDGSAPAWGDGPITPETGQTTTLRVFNAETQAQIVEFSGLTGNSYAMPTASLADGAVYEVQFLSMRDGIESLQGATRRLSLNYAGYGLAYGKFYGGL